MLVVKVAALEAYKRIAEARLQEYESINRSLQQELIAAKASNATMNDRSKEGVENMKEEVFINFQWQIAWTVYGLKRRYWTTLCDGPSN